MKPYKLLIIILVLVFLFGLNIPYGNKYLSVDVEAAINTEAIYVVMNETQNNRADITVTILNSDNKIENDNFCINSILNIKGQQYPQYLTQSAQSAQIKNIPIEPFSIILTKKPCDTTQKLEKEMISLQVKPIWKALSLYDRIRYAT